MVASSFVWIAEYLEDLNAILGGRNLFVRDGRIEREENQSEKKLPLL